MTREKLVEIHAALDKANGNIAVAADLLGIPGFELRSSISGNAELALRWSRDAIRHAVPVSEMEALSRDRSRCVNDGEKVMNGDAAVVPDNMSPDEMRLYEATIKEDHALRIGLSRMQLSEKEAALAFELTNFNRKNFANSVHMIGGGVNRTAIIFQVEIDRLRTRLSDVQELIKKCQPILIEVTNENGTKKKVFVGGEQREYFVAEERRLYESMIAMARETSHMFDVALKGASMVSMIKHRIKNGKKINSKPGFRSLPAPETSDA